MRKNVFLPNGNNKSTFQPEGAAPAASSLKSSYIKNEEKLSKERGTLKLKGAEAKLRKWLKDFKFVDVATANEGVDWGKVPVVKM